MMHALKAGSPPLLDLSYEIPFTKALSPFSGKTFSSKTIPIVLQFRFSVLNLSSLSGGKLLHRTLKDKLKLTPNGQKLYNFTEGRVSCGSPFRSMPSSFPAGFFCASHGPGTGVSFRRFVPRERFYRLRNTPLSLHSFRKNRCRRFPPFHQCGILPQWKQGSFRGIRSVPYLRRKDRLLHLKVIIPLCGRRTDVVVPDNGSQRDSAGTYPLFPSEKVLDLRSYRQPYGPSLHLPFSFR